MMVILFLAFACIYTPEQLAAGQDIDCDLEAKSCATSQDILIKSKIQNYHFNIGCKSYKTGLDCLDNLSTNAATCDPYIHTDADALSNAKSMLFSASEGMCGLDGSVAGCAYDFLNCIDEVDVIEKALTAGNNDSACRAFITYSECVQLITHRMHCPVRVENFLQATEKQLKKKLSFSCFKTCDMALDVCVANVPENLYSIKMTKDEQEVACAELQAAIACINTSDIENICKKEKKMLHWKRRLDKKSASHHELCSIPAKTCFMEIEKCSASLRNHAGTVSTPDDVVKLCKEVDLALDCANRVSLSEICKGKDRARKLATTLNEQRAQIDVFCGVGQCRLAFPKCYDFIAEVRLNIESNPGNLICQEVKIALECADRMEHFKPCHMLEFSNFTFAETVAVLTDYKFSSCAANRIEETECGFYPECFLALTKVDKSPSSCKKSLWRKECAENLSKSCQHSQYSHRFAYVEETESLFQRQHCSNAQTLQLKFTVLMLLALLIFGILDRI